MFEKHATKMFVFFIIQIRPENTSIVVTCELAHDEIQIFINPEKRVVLFVDQEHKKKWFIFGGGQRGSRFD